MFSTRFTLLLAAAALFTLDLSVAAPTGAQIQACGNSVSLQGWQYEVTYSTTNTTLQTLVYDYDPAACYTTAVIPVKSIVLTNTDTGDNYNCVLKQFDGSGLLTTTCPYTYGELANDALAGSPNWGNIIKVGQIPTIATLEKDIQITAADPQTSGTVSSRRRRRAERNLPELSDADCPAGYSSCWTGVGNKVECLNTESDVTACGACPRSESTQDCTSIKGANQVTCEYSFCKIISCDKYHTLSANGTSCEPNGRRKRTDWWA